MVRAVEMIDVAFGYVKNAVLLGNPGRVGGNTITEELEPGNRKNQNGRGEKKSSDGYGEHLAKFMVHEG